MRRDVLRLEMDLRDPAVIAGEEAVEDLGEPDSSLAVDPAHDAKVDRGEAAIGQGEEITLVKIGMEEAVDHRLPEEDPDQRSGERLHVMAGLDQLPAVGQLDAVDPFERHHSPGGAGPVDLGHEEAGLGDQVFAELRSGSGLLPKVELAVGPLPERSDDEPGPEAGRLAAHRLDLRGRPFVGLDRAGKILLDIGPEDLDRDLRAFGRDRAMDLGDRGGADRDRVDLREHLLDRATQRLLDRRTDLLEGRGGQAVLQRRQIVRGFGADQVGAGGERLAELDRGGADCLESLGIAGHVRHAGAEAGEAARAGGPAAACSGRARCRAARRAAPAPGPISAGARYG